MTKKGSRNFSRSFKLSAIERMESGENISALSRELMVKRAMLYRWRDAFRDGGESALRGKGRPRKGEAVYRPPKGSSEPKDELARGRERIAALERKIEQQQLDLDFFEQALRHMKEIGQRPVGAGVSASTKSSKR